MNKSNLKNTIFRIKSFLHFRKAIFIYVPGNSISFHFGLKLHFDSNINALQRNYLGQRCIKYTLIEIYPGYKLMVQEILISLSISQY